MFATYRSWLATRAERCAERFSGRPRRLLAVSFFVLAGFSALRDRSPRSVPDVAVAVVSRNLEAGAVLARDDVVLEHWPESAHPPATPAGPDLLVGRRIAAPMARGEPLTPTRLLDTAVAGALRSDQVAVTVHVQSTGSVGLIQPGSRIDLYARPVPGALVDGAPVESNTGRALVASGVTVLACFSDAALANATLADAAGSSDSTTVVFAASRPVASQVANTPSGAFLATLLPPS